MAEKADTAILIRMERLGVRRAFPKKRLGVLIVSGPCLERLAKQSKCFRKVGWFAVPKWRSGIYTYIYRIAAFVG